MSGRSVLGKRAHPRDEYAEISIPACRALVNRTDHVRLLASGFVGRKIPLAEMLAWGQSMGMLYTEPGTFSFDDGTGNLVRLVFDRDIEYGLDEGGGDGDQGSMTMLWVVRGHSILEG